MASAGVSHRGLEELPDEILLAILAYLDEKTLTTLQLVSRSFRDICRDDRLWKSRCFDESKFYFNFLYRQMVLQSQIDRAKATRCSAHDRTPVWAEKLRGLRAIGRTQVRANWDPSYPGEPISWYDEYIQRYARTVTNWFQNPYRNGATKGLLNEVRGLALYAPEGIRGEFRRDPLFAVSPLEDGTVCLFDINGTQTSRGAISGKSAPGVLFPHGYDPARARRESRINSVTECVAVDSQSSKAFFAVQSQLVEVDLQRLDVVSQQSFEWSITALSEATPGVPLTVGTSLGLHLYDHRAPRTHSSTHDEKIDLFSRIFSNDPLPAYAPLSQPTPLCIHHLPEAGHQDVASNDIYIAGRFPSILWYDRRQWPHILGSIHSGARLVSLSSIPYPLPPDVQRRKLGEIPQERILEAKSVRGQTLVAGGEYETKGSLELVGLRSQEAGLPGESSPNGSARRQKPWSYEKGSIVQNRQTASGAKIFSAIPHGSRIAFSDGRGDVSWFERDGLTEVRRHKIGSPEDHSSSQPSMFVRAETGDFARKLVSTRTRPAGSGEVANCDDLVFWTGERLGMITFSSRKGSKTKDFDPEEDRDAELDEEVEKYSGMMRRALEVQADEVRLTRNLLVGANEGTSTFT
ncbi:hypothetical protein VUR80DRAFT_2700 [Thermomyces stellatus]